MLGHLPGKKLRDCKECSSSGDVQQLEHRRGQHQQVEAALIRLEGEGDDTKDVTNDAT